MFLGSSQPLTKVSGILLGVKGGLCVRLTTAPQSANLLYNKRRNLDVSYHFGPPRPITGVALCKELVKWFLFQVEHETQLINIHASVSEISLGLLLVV
jgi:hypothetical protein